MPDHCKLFLLAMLCVSLLLGASWLPFAGRAPIASAHAFVIGSDPIDGSTVSKPPALVRIYFDAPIAAFSTASVYAFPPGAPANGLLVSAGPSTVNATNPNELDTSLLPGSKLPRGAYEVYWTALSLTDGHTTSGLIGFNLGSSGLTGTPTLGPSTSNTFPQLDLQGALAVAWDWLILVTLFFWIGMRITDYFIVPRAAPAAFLTQARKHSRLLSTLCLIALLVGEAINLILHATSFTQALGNSGINLAMIAQLVLNTNYGRLWLARMGLLLLALFFHWRSGSPTETAQSTPASARSGKHFSQLRQQARGESMQDAPASPTVSMLVRSQARVSGAVAMNVPSAYSTGSSLPRITAHFARAGAAYREPSTWQKTCWLLLAGLILLTLVLSNEIIQIAPLPISAGVFSWLSLAAQAMWFGCAAYLGLILLPLLPALDADHHAETLAALLKRATPLLLIALGVLLVSEIFLSEATIFQPQQLLNDPYGRALLVRAVLLVLMAIFTGFILLLLLPRFARQTILLPVVDAEMPARRARKSALRQSASLLRRWLQGIAALAALTLICAALMNFFAPPVVYPNINYSALTNPFSSGSSNSAPVILTQHSGDLTATLQVLPARAGVTNTLTLALVDAQNKAVTGATVKLSINMELMNMGIAEATMHGNGVSYTAIFSATSTFTMGGTWAVQVEIDRPQQPLVHLTFQVLVAPQ